MTQRIEPTSAPEWIEADLVLWHEFLPELSVSLAAPWGAAHVIDIPRSTDLQRIEIHQVIPFSLDEWSPGVWTLSVTDPAEGDLGWLLYFHLEVHQPEEQPARFPLSIPDDDPNGATLTFHLSDSGTADTVCLRLSLEHPFPVELEISLASPAGTLALLKPYGEAMPAGPLTTEDFSGEPMPGDWRLSLVDSLPSDSGILWDASLDPRCLSEDGDWDESEEEIGEEEAHEEEIPVPLRGTCASPILLADSVFNLNLLLPDDSPSQFSIPPVCWPFDSPGPEQVLRVVLEADSFYDLEVESPSFDAMVAVLNECSDAPAYCRAGDRAGIGPSERLLFKTEEAGPYLILIDSASSDAFGSMIVRMSPHLDESPYLVRPTAVLPVAIPDAGGENLVTVGRTNWVRQLDRVCVTLDLVHPRPDELSILLESPFGSFAALHFHEGAEGGLKRTTSFLDFAGEWSWGEWSLTFIDEWAGNSGTLVDWTVNLACGSDLPDEGFLIEPNPNSDCALDLFMNTNDQPETAIPLPVPSVIENLTVCDDTADWFRFDLVPGREIHIRVEFDSTQGDIDLRLYREGQYGSVVASSSEVGDWEQIDFTPEERGFYYLKVLLYSLASNSYRLQLSNEIISRP